MMWRMQQGRVIATEIKIHLTDCQENLGWSFEMSEKVNLKLRIYVVLYCVICTLKHALCIQYVIYQIDFHSYHTLTCQMRKESVKIVNVPIKM